MELLKVAAYPVDGRVAVMDNLPLDSILAWSWMCQHYPLLILNDGWKWPIERVQAYHDSVQAGVLNPHVGNIDADIPVLKEPFTRMDGIEDYFYHASACISTPRREDVTYWRKRFDVLEAERAVEFGKKRGSVDVKSGKYKNYSMPLVIRLFDRLEWYLTGDGAVIEELLAGVHQLGKKQSQGFGEIRKWRVEPTDRDWGVRDDTGKLTRDLPVNLSQGVPLGRVAQKGYRAPYWHYWFQQACALRGCL